MTEVQIWNQDNCIGSTVRASQHPSHRRRNSHVNLRIKSLIVPELFIELEETATIGLLKRMVVEALSAILGGGVCIGVLLQGKKVKNDCCRVGFLMIMNLILWTSQLNPTLLPLQLKVLDFLMFHFPAVHLILVLGNDVLLSHIAEIESQV
ncbi:hypothetical protein SAY86_019347 [Trapa natans]|uniref:Telomere repeat-binding protein 1-6-like ubiquitin-like domain-containing protein n=1 Tax=Trapa natans TaxID=22666 RepID=A0AAN7R6S5_TRANT|nr:hypothetical protein SAY86_019347 [Trapa natans]